jgi:hypothetical protein
MIRCLPHQRALRRRIEHGEALSEAAHQHVDACPACQAELRLAGAHVLRTEAPPFLHARIMNSVRNETVSRRAELSLAWKLAPVLVVAMAFALVMAPKDSSKRELAAKPQPWKIAAFAAPELPQEAPLETELANLQADTVNAARALAENFLPSNLLR